MKSSVAPAEHRGDCGVFNASGGECRCTCGASVDRALVEGGGTDEQVAAYERGEHDSMIREYDRARGEQEDQRG